MLWTLLNFFSLNNFNRTSYLAGCLSRALQKKINEQGQKQLEISDKEILCLELGGLCHDLGTLKLPYLYPTVYQKPRQNWSWFIWRSFWFIIIISFFVYRSWSIFPLVRFNVLPKSKREKQRSSKLDGNSCCSCNSFCIIYFQTYFISNIQCHNRFT